MPVIPSQFEEKEYETSLYQELVSGPGMIWSPGQVLEHHFGVDALVEATGAYWAVVRRKRKAGVLPQGIRLGSRGLAASLPGIQQCSFSANLFVQVKRCQVYTQGSRPRGVPKRPSATWYTFRTDKAQQRVLEHLHTQFSAVPNHQAAADISYAAPCFSSRADLFAHSASQRLVENSTFPLAISLRGHNRWAYTIPGSTGLALSIPREVSDPKIDVRTKLLYRHHTRRGEVTKSDMDHQIASIRDAVQSSLADARVAPLSLGKDPYFSQREGEPHVRVAVILANLAYNGIAWFVVGAERA